MLSCVMDFVNSPSSFYIAIAVVTLSILYYVMSYRGLPPGPIGIPYFGYWPFFPHHNLHFYMHELAKKYGDVFSFTVTGRTYIHLGSYKAAREAHITKADSFRERVSGFNIIYYFLEDGVAFAPYDQWKTMRKFFLQQFRERGMNVLKENLSDALYDPVNEAVVELKRMHGKPVNISELIVAKSSKIMRLALLGEDGMSEEELFKFIYLYADIIESQIDKSILLTGEIARYFILPFYKTFNKSKGSHEKLKAMLYEMINRRKATYNENHIRDIVDDFIKEREDRKMKNDPTYKFFTDKCLMSSLIQIIGDGILFMGMFITAFIQNLMDHPEEQEKLYQELVEVCGLDRNPKMDDKSKLTYTNAFILEVMRTTDVLAYFPSTECTKETTIHGYRIPKGAFVLYNFYTAHRNANDYEEPDKFNPSRFICDKSKKPDMLPLFGIGKRSCMGEGFTMNQVFLFLTTLVKNFRLSKPPGTSDLKTMFGADKIEVIAEPRLHK